MQTEVRFHALDAVRAFALLLGVVLHSTMAYWPWLGAHSEGGYPPADISHGWTSAIIFFVIHIFRMTLFFMIAGFFTRLVFHRRGIIGFVKDRAKRVAVPLVVGWSIFIPLTGAAFIWAMYKDNGNVMPELPSTGTSVRTFPLAYFWFLYQLLLMYALSIPVRSITVRLDKSGALRRSIDTLMLSAGSSPFAPILLAAPLAVVLCFTGRWVMWLGIPTPSLVPQLPATIGFGTAFIFGWLMQRQPETLRVWEKRWPLNLALALILTIACLRLHGMGRMLSIAVPGTTKIAYAVCYSIASWTWVFAIIGVGMKYCSTESPLRRYIADSSYWLYIAHVPLVVALHALMMKWPINWSIKFALVLLVCYPLLFVSYHYLIRPTFLGEWLNGRKYPRSPLLSVWRTALANKASQVSQAPEPVS